MRRALPIAVLAAAALAVGAVAAPAMDGMGGEPGAAKVSVLYAAFQAPQIAVVAGDTVQWSNDSSRAHDVVAADGSFDSGRLVVGGMFDHRFDRPGVVPYYCSLHPFMTGEIDVENVLLDTPAARGATGRPFVLTGRVAAGATGSVAIEGDDGTGFAPAGTAVPAIDGTFRATVVPRTTTTYRAVTEDGTSPPVQVLVLDHAVTVTRSTRGARTTLSVHVTPAAPGQPVVLQLLLRERFGWWPTLRARLDASSSARFTVARRGVVPARVVLTLPDGATELARSRTVHVGAPRRRASG
ncbi:hypothetical protein FSW04_00970 [Baekduia soli]|uniref:Blue (type 1) copper domain-containing protein n=1 Tax=Baekduia soli TaxID=496014 RepID=A0A5B8TZY1_9ACTN|nr:plastocyanin/azurin family copper-binding protein [Baekduia soli]QEC46287.1 hypothetical protein FSW04_00970 [Baekduia soli]